MPSAAGRLLFGAAQSVRRVQGAFWLVDKLEPLNLAVDRQAPRRVNIVHPAIDLKHFFGGFIAVFNLARRLAERGHSVRLVALEGPELPRDWRRQLAGYEGIGSWIDGLEVAFAADRSRPLEVNPDDTLIATHWNAAHVAAAALRHLRRQRFLYLIQEYEPFIFPMGSAGALCRRSYELPHTAMFSTELLRDWFAHHRVGVYAAGDRSGRAPPRSASTTRSPRSARSSRSGAARPGAAAAAVLRSARGARGQEPLRDRRHGARPRPGRGPLRRAGTWSAIGTVEARGSELILPRSGRSLRLAPRTSQAEYADAAALGRRRAQPHVHAPPEPSADRDGGGGNAHGHQHLREQGRRGAGRISANLIAAEPTVEGVLRPSRRPSERSERLEERASGLARQLAVALGGLAGRRCDGRGRTPARVRRVSRAEYDVADERVAPTPAQELVGLAAGPPLGAGERSARPRPPIRHRSTAVRLGRPRRHSPFDDGRVRSDLLAARVRRLRGRVGPMAERGERLLGDQGPFRRRRSRTPRTQGQPGPGAREWVALRKRRGRAGAWPGEGAGGRRPRRPPHRARRRPPARRRRAAREFHRELMRKSFRIAELEPDERRHAGVLGDRRAGRSLL